MPLGTTLLYTIFFYGHPKLIAGDNLPAEELEEEALAKTGFFDAQIDVIYLHEMLAVPYGYVCRLEAVFPKVSV